MKDERGILIVVLVLVVVALACAVPAGVAAEPGVVSVVGLPEHARLGQPVTWVATRQGGSGPAMLGVVVQGSYREITVSTIPESTACTVSEPPRLVVYCTVWESPASVTVRAVPVITRRVVQGMATLTQDDQISVAYDYQFMQGVTEAWLPLVQH